MSLRADFGSTRNAMTLIELMVAIALIGLLVAILLPAVQFARRAAQRSQCLNNLRQIGIGLHSYHETVGSLPPGRFKLYDPRFSGPNPPCSAKSVDKSFLIDSLPYLDNTQLFNTINQNLAMLGPENTSVWSVSVSVFSCPSDIVAGRPQVLQPDQLPTYAIPALTDSLYYMVFTSYSGCFGSLNTSALPKESSNCFVAPQRIGQNNGCFNDRSPISFASITDGLSNTMLASEKTNRESQYGRYGWYVTGNLGDTLFTALYPPNLRTAEGGSHPAAAFSFHAGGVTVLMADGAARFIRDTIQSWQFDDVRRGPVGAMKNAGGWWENLPPSGIWQKLATRAEGDFVLAESY